MFRIGSFGALNKHLYWVWGRYLHAMLTLVNSLFHVSSGWRDRQIVYDLQKTCPHLIGLVQDFSAIQQEVRGQREILRMSPEYHHIDPMQRPISQSMNGRRWQTLFLSAQGMKFSENCAHFPITCATLGRVPRVFQAFFSRLESGKMIPAHASPYHGYIRFHLALEVPAIAPPFLVVGGQRLDWIEGAGFLFDDSFPHYVVNYSQHDRVILVVDIERPMSGLGKATARVMTALLHFTYARGLHRNAGRSSWLS